MSAADASGPWPHQRTTIGEHHARESNSHRLSGAVGLDDEVRQAILTSLIVDTPTEVVFGDESQR